MAETVDREISALCRATENGREMAIKTLIAGRPIAKTTDRERLTTLYRVAENRHEAAVKT